MPATTSQPTTIHVAIADPAAEKPSVTYCDIEKKIYARVIVSWLLGQPKPTFKAPLIAVPGPDLSGDDTWTVLWTLITGVGVQSVKFSENTGIEFPGSDHLPARARIAWTGKVPDKEDQWCARIWNNVTDANSFRYKIHADVCRSSATQENQDPCSPGSVHWKEYCHDPTIAVTKDPLDPPSSTSGGRAERLECRLGA